MLDRFEEANLDKITNLGAFLTGIARRVAAEGSADLTRCLDMLPRPLRHTLGKMMDDGRLKKGDLESRVATALRVRFSQPHLHRAVHRRSRALRRRTCPSSWRRRRWSGTRRRT